MVTFGIVVSIFDVHLLLVLLLLLGVLKSICMNGVEWISWAPCHQELLGPEEDRLGSSLEIASALFQLTIFHVIVAHGAFQLLARSGSDCATSVRLHTSGDQRSFVPSMLRLRSVSSILRRVAARASSSSMMPAASALRSNASRAYNLFSSQSPLSWGVVGAFTAGASLGGVESFKSACIMMINPCPGEVYWSVTLFLNLPAMRSSRAYSPCVSWGEELHHGQTEKCDGMMGTNKCSPTLHCSCLPPLRLALDQAGWGPALLDR